MLCSITVLLAVGLEGSYLLQNQPTALVTRVTGFGQALTLLLIVQTKRLLLALLISLAGLAAQLLVPDQI